LANALFVAASGRRPVASGELVQSMTAGKSRQLGYGIGIGNASVISRA